MKAKVVAPRGGNQKKEFFSPHPPALSEKRPGRGCLNQEYHTGDRRLFSAFTEVDEQWVMACLKLGWRGSACGRPLGVAHSDRHGIRWKQPRSG